MSWIQKLYETYEQCAGNEPDGTERLMPISHTTQQAHIEVVINSEGDFRRASVIKKEDTVIPATEKSAGRSSGEAAHALCDKIQYCAKDYADDLAGFGGKKPSYFFRYQEQLQLWCKSQFSHQKAQAVLSYVNKGRLIADLVDSKVLQVLDGVLEVQYKISGVKKGSISTQNEAEKNQSLDIFKQLTFNDKGIKDQGDALVRWRVEELNNPMSATWEDQSLTEAWTNYYASIQNKRGLCMVSGVETTLALQHPAKLRHGGDKAKLISSNDAGGYTYRGRFIDSDEAVGLGFDVSQKAHNALRWLIKRQAYKSGDQVIVSWAISGKLLPDPFANTLALLGMGDTVVIETQHLDTAQAFALRLNKAIAGFRARLNPRDDVVVMGVDSATPGRMAISFYRELKGSDFLQRVEDWHAQCAWPQNFGKDSKFTGAPAPQDIAEAAFGRRLDEKLRKATVERLLPCIIDGQLIPRYLIESTKRRACNRVGLENWEWEKCLGIACSLHKAFYHQRNYQMSLETDRKTRDYLYGRMLAIAEKIEAIALSVAGEKRDTTAARLMQRFSDRPFSTWKTIELALVPYKTRLRSRRMGFLVNMEKLLDEVSCAFQTDDYTNDRPLSGEFLLGYHCQRQALKPSDATGSAIESNQDNNGN